MDLIIKEVETKNELKQFINFPNSLYRGVKYYIPPLTKNEYKSLNKSTNPAFAFCDVKLWLALASGKVVGRIAGIINHAYNKQKGQIFIRFGRFDFEEDVHIAKALLETVETWGKTQDGSFIHGPLGFISFDRSGVLVEGFEELPTSFGGYNFPYYDKLIMQCGYEKDVDWIEHLIKMPEKMPEKILKAAILVEKRSNLTNVVLKNNNDILRYADALFDMLNTAYEDIYGFVKLTPEIIANLKKEFISYLDHRLVSIITDAQNNVVGFSIAMPSMAKALKKANGRLFPFGIFHLLKAMKKNDLADLVLIGVRPDYQNKGVHALMFDKVLYTLISKGYKYVEMTRVLENNKKMLQLSKMFETRVHKRARCYIKSL